MFGILEAVAVPHSGVFDTYEDLMKELNGRMEKEGYKIVKARSHRSRMGGADIPGNEIVRCDLVCDRGGRPYKCMATKHKTTTKKTDCPWKAKAVNRKTIGGWVLTISCDQHNHAPGTPEPPTPSEASDDEAIINGNSSNSNSNTNNNNNNNSQSNINAINNMGSSHNNNSNNNTNNNHHHQPHHHHTNHSNNTNHSHINVEEELGKPIAQFLSVLPPGLSIDDGWREEGQGRGGTGAHAVDDVEIDCQVLNAPDLGPRLDTETSTAMQLAGVSEPNLRLTGDAFHQLKTDYRKMAQPDRLNALAQLQLRLAAIYAVQNEDWQRQRRQEAQDRRHQQVDKNRKQTASQKQRMRRQRRQTEPIPQQQQQPPPPPQVQPDAAQQQQQQQQQQPLPQSMAQPQQMQQDAQQAAQIQPMMQEAHFQLGPGAGHAQAPLAEMTMQQFQHFSNPPKQMRGHRPGMPGQPDMQQL